MKRTELTDLLRKEHQKNLPCGVMKGLDKKYQHIWFVIPPAPPIKIKNNFAIELLSQANRILKELPLYAHATPLDRTLSYLFLRQEALCSSRMEGTWSTIDEVLTPKELVSDPDEKSESSSIKEYAHVLEKIFKTAQHLREKIFTEKMILELHKSIAEKDPTFTGRPGKLRSPGEERSVVWIGGLRIEDSIYNPTPPTHVKKCLKIVLSWFRNTEIIELGNAGMGLSLPVRMAIGHAHFEAVHPFSDGNGRVGRMLLALQMVLHDVLPLYLSGFIESQRHEYSKALQQAQKKLNYGPMVEFICTAIIESHQKSLKTKSRLLALPEKWQNKGGFRKNSSAWKMLDLLLHEPIFSILHFQKKLGISHQAANQAVMLLLNQKIVTERTGFSRNRVFSAHEVIQILSGK